MSNYKNGLVEIKETENELIIGNNTLKRKFNKIITSSGIKIKTSFIYNILGSSSLIAQEDSEEFIICGLNKIIETEFIIIKASKLTLNKIEISNTNTLVNQVNKNGKILTFKFNPITFGSGELTVAEKFIMYDDDSFMRKFLELESTDNNIRIDYIDFEHLKLSESDKIWTIPTNRGGIVEMEDEIANLGQPIYINGMFIGCEFPATDTQIVNRIGRVRYYTGKNFNDFKRDNQLSEDNKYISWNTVIGASCNSGNNNNIIQSYFFDYINTISTPTKFRIQYNSWFDNMMRITDENILYSFKQIEKNLSYTGVRPLDSYVVDDGWNIYRKNKDDLQGKDDIERNGKGDINTKGFWQFNSKFPNGLSTSSSLVQKFGSNFGLWVGPRGGYNYYSMLADIIKEDGNGSKSGNSIDVSDTRYINKFEEMIIQLMKDYNINYWKWDGFADKAQLNDFKRGEGIVGYDKEHCHMYGGINGMYHITDLWEKWITLFKNVRNAQKDLKIDNLWISLTCYVNPSPWYLQWANSVWLQCSGDRGETKNSVLNNMMDNMLTYRDACYYDFIINHQFQFPLANIYNHDPVYGKEETGITANSMNGDEFRNYLFMQGTRGTSFWELYYSNDLLDEEKYLINSDFLHWVESNFSKLKNAKMIGGKPAENTTLNPYINIVNQNPYGFSCFDQNGGIISMRNPDNKAKTFTFKLDESIGVKSDGTYYMTLEHGYINSGNITPTKSIFKKDEVININLQPGETQIWNLNLKKNINTLKLDKIYIKNQNKIQVKVCKRLNIEEVIFNVKINSKKVNVKVEKLKDFCTFNLYLEENMDDGDIIEVIASFKENNNLNIVNESRITTKYYENNIIAEIKSIKEPNIKLSNANRSVKGNNGFTITAKIKTNDKNITLLKQGNEYALGIDLYNHPYFILNGLIVTSEEIASSKYETTITAVKENNGLIKIYINGEISNSKYKVENKDYEIIEDDIIINNINGSLTDIKVYNKSLGFDEIICLNN